MFQLISKAYSFVSGSLSSFDGSPTRTSVGSYPSIDLDASVLASETEFEDNPLLNKNFSGTVTCYFNGRGLIDDEVYFAAENVLGGQSPDVGAAVHVTAERGNRNDGWKATQVILSGEDWSNEIDDAEHFLTKITHIKYQIATTENGKTIDLRKSQYNFIPHVGDWVSIKEIAEDSLSKIVSFHALRTKTFDGEITELTSYGGVIDDDVRYVHQSYFSSNSAAVIGEKVHVTAIESTHGDCSWRATSVRPILNQRDEAVHNRLNGVIKVSSSHMQKLLELKEGIDLVGEGQFGEVTMETTKEIEIEIRNTSESSKTLSQIVILSKDSQFICELDTKVTSEEKNQKDETDTSVTIEPDSSHTVKLKLVARHLGIFKELAVLRFVGFEIGIYLQAVINDPMESVLQATSSFQRRQKNKNRLADCLKRNGRTILPGQKLKRKSKMFLPKKLGQFEIPEQLKAAIRNGDVLDRVAPEVLGELTFKTYLKKMKTLLHIEEIKREEDMEQFNLFKVPLVRDGNLLVVGVPGLSESRPSVLLGDRMVLNIDDTAKMKAPAYEGFVHEVGFNQVGVKFHQSFHQTYNNELCDVAFFSNRTPIRRAHQAIEKAINMGEKVLFPSVIISKASLGHLSMPKDLINKSLNERQQAAVRHILAGIARPSPYLLFGPPGTGKTVTLVEAAIQVFKRIPSSRLLVCAPSNSAADLLAERICESNQVTPADLIRLNAFQRMQPVPEIIEDFTTNQVDDINKICRHRIIICTCSMAGLLLCFGLEASHFTHVFVDEAGQATEPECLIGIALVANNNNAQIVLAGDHFQLGPVLQSQIAMHHGLNISFLERLMERPCYQRNELMFGDHGSYDPLLVTKLVQSYRSQTSILRLYSKVFYNDELIASGDKAMVDSCTHWNLLPSSPFQILFHGIRGAEMREGNCPSWFNPSEAVQIFTYVKHLLGQVNLGLDQSEIGVITPYRSQVKKIRMLFNEVGFDDIKVASVEEFQGQERKVIILSTVRSDEEAVSKELKHCLGFLSNPRRFNVSISRAKALLVVVGNPYILCLDPYWCCLVQYCVSNGSFVGSDLPSLDSDEMKESFAKAINFLGIKGDDHMSTANVDDSDDEEEITQLDLNQKSRLAAITTTLLWGHLDQRTQNRNFEAKQECYNSVKEKIETLLIRHPIEAKTASSKSKKLKNQKKNNGSNETGKNENVFGVLTSTKLTSEKSLSNKKSKNRNARRKRAISKKANEATSITRNAPTIDNQGTSVPKSPPMNALPLPFTESEILKQQKKQSKKLKRQRYQKRKAERKKANKATSITRNAPTIDNQGTSVPKSSPVNAFPLPSTESEILKQQKKQSKKLKRQRYRKRKAERKKECKVTSLPCAAPKRNENTVIPKVSPFDSMRNKTFLTKNAPEIDDKKETGHEYEPDNRTYSTSANQDIVPPKPSCLVTSTPSSIKKAKRKRYRKRKTTRKEESLSPTTTSSESSNKKNKIDSGINEKPRKIADDSKASKVVDSVTANTPSKKGRKKKSEGNQAFNKLEESEIGSHTTMKNAGALKPIIPSSPTLIISPVGTM